MTPERREDGWDELRREIEALHVYGAEKQWDFIKRAAVLPIVDRLAAARGEPEIDVKRLARALPGWMVEHPLGQTEDQLRATIATNVAAEYDRLGSE